MFKRLPTTVITGFLGAGKTTYLNGLISNNTISAHSLIIVNDFGSINIDADLIEHRQDNIVKLTNGCVCCTISDDLDTQLKQILTTFDGLKDVYIETSGISNPMRVANMVKLSDTCNLQDIICLIDMGQAERFLQDTMVQNMWIQQVKSATHIILNRIPQQDAPIRTKVCKMNPTAHISMDDTVHDGDKITAYTVVAPIHTNSDLKAQTKSFSVGFEGIIPIEKIENILMQYGDVLLRAKGMLCVGQGTVKILQVSGNRISWHPCIQKQAHNKLVCIGRQSKRLYQLQQQLLHIN